MQILNILFNNKNIQNLDSVTIRYYIHCVFHYIDFFTIIFEMNRTGQVILSNVLITREILLAIFCIACVTGGLIFFKRVNNKITLHDIGWSFMQTSSQLIRWVIWDIPRKIFFWGIRTFYYIAIITVSIRIAMKIESVDFSSLSNFLKNKS